MDLHALLLAALRGHETALAQAGLLLLRLLPLVVFTPLFGGLRSPVRLRFGVAILLTLTLAPHAAAASRFDWATCAAGDLCVAVVRELFVGACGAVMLRTVFGMVASAGALIDLSRGATAANVLDPIHQERSSLLSGFYRQLFMAVFLCLGGYRILLRAFAAHLAHTPIAAPLPARFAPMTFVADTAALLADLMALVLQLAAPVVAVLFIVDLTLGLISRAAPQIQAFFLGITIKATLGMLVALPLTTVIVDALLDRLDGDFLAWWTAG